MDTRELRIGNYVQHKDHKTLEIEVIFMGSVYYRIVSTNAALRNVGECLDCEFEGIPITAELLEKCGAIESVLGWYQINHFDLNPVRKLTSLFGTYIEHCEYLHQLQNLYFALSGEELETNQTPQP